MWPQMRRVCWEYHTWWHSWSSQTQSLKKRQLQRNKTGQDSTYVDSDLVVQYSAVQLFVSLYE